MERTMAFSKIKSHIRMYPSHANPQGTVQGGELMKYMEDTAGMAAMKHCGGNVVAARVDELLFLKPVPVGNIVTFTAQVAYAGSSSMQVIVSVDVHDLNDFSKTEKALSAFFTLVHVDDNGRPAKIPSLKAADKTDEIFYQLGKQKYLAIKASR